MNPLLSIFISIGALATAAAYPFLIRHDRVKGALQSLVPEGGKPRRNRGFAAISPSELNRPKDWVIRRNIVEGAILTAIVAFMLFVVGDSHGTAGRLSTPFAALLGVSGALIARQLWITHEQLKEVRRCTECMQQGGFEGTWQGDSEDPIPFRQHFILALQESTSLEVVAPCGLEAFSILSHPARAAFEAPHPALAGKRLRLIVLPPRSQKTDPQKTIRSCAEEAISRAGSTPEKHWRRLQSALEIQRRWNGEYGCQIEVRFLEGRPIHALFLTGVRGWFRPWFGSRTQWYEVASRGTGTGLRTSIEDGFESTWQEASEELSVFLRKDGRSAVMSTSGSDAIQKTRG